MNNLIFISDNFWPETNAPATRTYEHCREWVKGGVNVTVVTSFPNYPEGKVHNGYKNSLKKIEFIDGIKVVRLWSFIRPNKGFYLRILDQLSFAFSAFLYLLFINKKSFDVMVATSPQFFVGITALLISKIKNKPYFFEVRDLWPEGIILIKKDGFLYKILEKIEFYYYYYSAGIITVTSSFKSNIINRFKIPREKIHVVYNGSNNELFQKHHKSKKLINELGLKNKFIVGYAGTVGVSHALDFILDCSKDINEFEKKIHFLFIGSGSEFEKIKSRIDKENLLNVSLFRGVNKNNIVEYLSIFDFGLVNLKKYEGYLKVIPSKIFELAAMNKPILLGVDGESRDIINKYKAGIFFEPENKTEFLNACKKMISTDLNKYKHGLKNISNDFDRIMLANKMLEFIKSRIK